MSLYLDLSEFLSAPMKTGIQRISGEICSYLPSEAAIAVRLNEDHYVALPPELVGVIGKYFRADGESWRGEINRLGAVENGLPIKVSLGDTALVPEVFDNPQRLQFFRNMREPDFARCRFIIFDLLPMTHPEYFPPGTPLNLAGYYQVARRASRSGFISEYTRDAYYHRLKRAADDGGVVLPLGCDSLGPKPQGAKLDRPLEFTVLGTIEPRKNHALIMDAFEPLLQQIDGLSLSFIGKMGWVDSAFAQRVHTLAADKGSGFRFYPASGDEAIRRRVEQSRATIYVSAAEGYGLPPVESLWVGTPVIASIYNPSLKNAGGAGIHFVEPLTAVNLRRAILAFLDDAYANQKVEEAMRTHLPTWRSFTTEVLRWCQQE